MRQGGGHAIAKAVAALGAGPLTEAGIAACIRPLFSQTLATGRVYLSTHAMGRPLDQMQADLREGADLWAQSLRYSWGSWLEEEARYREAIASLLGLARPDCVVPKPAAEHGLRAVLNTVPLGATVVTTEGEFSAVAVVLAQYAALGRLRVVRAAPDRDGRWTAASIAEVLRREAAARLVVLSHVFYQDGQLFRGLPELASECHARGAALLVDAYHSLGAVPFTMGELGCDYLIGGCYKYLRGGPGAAFLAMTPEKADSVRPLDVGWFGMEPDGDAWAPDGPPLRAGGDGWLEGSPPVLTYYQARSGLLFTEAIGVERLRAYSLEQLQFLRELLLAHDIDSEGGNTSHGAFLTITVPHAPELVRALSKQGIVIDERGGKVRVCPDCLTTRAELEQFVDALRRTEG